jgi:lipoate-protein ligase A
MPDTLRVVDLGEVDPLRSQTLWHAIAYGVSAGAPPTLSFVRPAAAYVCLGFHRRLDEVDVDYCAREGLSVFRRMVGGGPVYLDRDQLFFQICLPASQVPLARTAALRALLSPAVEAFRAVGVDAALDEHLEITVGDVKICGHGAGQIADAVIVCGNLIERFDHARAARVLDLPDERMRAEVERLMRRHVGSTDVDPKQFRDAAVDTYARALALTPVAGELTSLELGEADRLDAQFSDPEWVAGDARPQPRARQVKVRAGVWAFAAEHAGAQVVASVREGRVERAWLRDPQLNGGTSAAEAGVRGLSLDAVPDALAGFGEPGRRLAAAFAAADGNRL